jgi:hypothetical protein
LEATIQGVSFGAQMVGTPRIGRIVISILIFTINFWRTLLLCLIVAYAFLLQFNGQGRMGTGEILPGSRIAQTLSVIIRGGCTCL